MSDALPRRLLAYVEPRSFIAVRLLEALLRETATRPDLELVAVVDAGRAEPEPAAAFAARLLAATVVKRLGGSGRRAFWHGDMLRDARAVARRRRVPVVVPPGRDVNHPDHVAAVRDRLRPDHVLTLGCLQVLGAELLAACGPGLNYHNGRLPGYRGLGATAWSLYEAQATSGYAFHRLERGVDAGAVLLAGEVVVPAGASAMELEHRKSVAAARDLPAALALLLAGEPGEPQGAGGRTFRRAALARVRRVGPGDAVTAAELERRLAAFDVVWLTVDGEALPVTAVTAADGRGRRGPAIATADGATMRVTRCLWLPVPLYRLARRLGVSSGAAAEPP